MFVTLRFAVRFRPSMGVMTAAHWPVKMSWYNLFTLYSLSRTALPTNDGRVWFVWLESYIFLPFSVFIVPSALRT